MIQKIGIKNYKSIVDDEIELGRINVFIGENGAGKSNILEAVAIISAHAGIDRSAEGLYNRGVRVARPDLMFNSFYKHKELVSIDLSISELIGYELETLSLELKPDDKNDIYSKWKDTSNFLIGGINREKLISTINYELAKSEKVDNIVSKVKSIIQNMMSDNIVDFQIYNLSILSLRGINQISKRFPLGINGEGLDILISTFTEEEMKILEEHSYFVSWLKEVIFDHSDLFKFSGYKLGRSTSRLYFKDQYMKRTNNIFAAENANEGALYVLFYLALFISKKTPTFFAIDNIETALNPKLCRELMKSIAALSKKTDKQALITTHNPAILDGINLNDDEQRLFVVSRTDDGHTKTRRIKLKPKTGKLKYKLSELWMNGDLGGIPNNFL